MRRYLINGVGTDTLPYSNPLNKLITTYATYGASQVTRTFQPSRLRTEDIGTTQLASANNKKLGRSNESRLNGRIPDIYGKVLAVPDLLTKPYIVYKDTGTYTLFGDTYTNQQAYEISYLCVGRGNISIANTEISSHAGATSTIDIYGPNTSPLTSTGSIGNTFVAPLESVSGFSSDITEHIMVKNPDYTENTDDSSTIGPFIFENCAGVSVNIIWGGVFSSVSGWYTGAVEVDIQLQLVTDSDVPYGSTHTVTKSFDTRQYCHFKTYDVDAPFSGRMQCKIIKSTGFLSGEGTPQILHKQVFLSNIYGKSKLDSTHFGDVTTMRVSLENESSVEEPPNLGTVDTYKYVAPKSLKLTCEATRSITGTDTAFSDIAKAVCLDTKIGNRTASEIDTTQLAALQTEIETYFGTSKAAEFNHTFDDINTSFEETLNTICRAAFVQVYRQGPVIKFKFEKPNTVSKLLLNHRNKIPGTETRTINFGYLNEKDGVSFQYTTINDAAKLDFKLPGNDTETNVETDGPVGITNKLQAYFHAHRQFNRQKYQNSAVELEATQEAELLLINDLIKVSNNTRPNTWDGEVISKEAYIQNVAVVRVRLTDTDFLNLNEVEVFEQGTGTNIALTGTATQSSTYDSNTGPEKAIDGDTTSNYPTSVSLTQSEAGAWWQVSFGGNFNVEKIIVYNRGTGGTRLEDAVVEALDASSNVIWSNTITGASDGSVHTFDLDATPILTLSQPYTGSNNASIFIQSTVSGVQSVGITKLANNNQQVILDSDITPSVSLEYGAFTKPVYEIVEDTSTRNDAFLFLK